MEKIKAAQVAVLLDTTPFSVLRGIKYGTLPIGWYTRLKGAKRGSAHIVPERLADYMNISVDELEERLKQTEK